MEADVHFRHRLAKLRFSVIVGLYYQLPPFTYLGKRGNPAYLLVSIYQKLTLRPGNQVSWMVVVVTVCWPVR